MDKRPIGVFDSGLGGLTVLKALIHELPHENYIYLGDTARLPYGSKSPQTIRAYSEQNLNFLAGQNVKSIVVACNSASTQIHETEFLEAPLLTVIEPGAQKALSLCENLRIGVLGTRATVESGAYAMALQKLDSKVEVFSVACPLFVPLAEEGWDQDPVTNLIAYRYLQGLLQSQVDTVILGCTHYPLLKDSIAKVLGNSIHLVDSGEAVAQQLKLKIKSNNAPSGQLKIYLTDSSAHFERMARRIMPSHLKMSFEIVNLN